jgi:DNA-directed RNA polymerase specialized sigma24 family protein
MKKQWAAGAPLRVPEVAMTGSSLSSHDTISGPLRDEAALESLFRTHFSALNQEAKSHLGESAATAAPKVVEGAFRQAWDERDQIATEADLGTYLHDAVRRSAARELSRRAGARHLGGASGAHATHAHAEATVDQAWQHLTRQLHPEQVRAEAAAYSEERRHHAAEHVADLSKARSWKLPVFFLIVVAAAAGGAMWYVTSLGADRAVTRALSSTDARTATANPGQTGTLTLGDSTKVLLGAGSKLTIPEKFNTEIRAVKILGAARFAVAPGNPLRFEIRAGDASVVATGTTIIARAYPNDPVVTINVAEGQATVRLGKEERALAAGQTVVIEKGDKMRDATPEETAVAVNWTNRRITISRKLGDVVAEMNRWLGTDMAVPENKARDRNASVDAPMDSMRVAIAQVEKSADVTFGYEGQNQTMVFRANTVPGVPNKK